MSGTIHGSIHGIAPDSFPGGMDRKGMEGMILAKALCILTVSSEPAWLPRRPAHLAGPMQDKR